MKPSPLIFLIGILTRRIAVFNYYNLLSTSNLRSSGALRHALCGHRFRTSMSRMPRALQCWTTLAVGIIAHTSLWSPRSTISNDEVDV